MGIFHRNPYTILYDINGKMDIIIKKGESLPSTKSFKFNIDNINEDVVISFYYVKDEHISAFGSSYQSNNNHYLLSILISISLKLKQN